MPFAMMIPRPPLDRYIECLWSVDLTMTSERERILPTGTVEWIINFGSPFHLIDRDDPTRYTVSRESWLVGLHTQYLINEPVAESNLIGVRFKPGGTFPFFRFPAHEIHNQVIEIDALMWHSGHTMRHLREQLYALPDSNARFAHLERWLLNRLSDSRKLADGTIYAASREIARLHGEVSIKGLGDSIGISQKHLAHQFKQIVGVAPKTLARLYRFQHVLKVIDPAKPVNWADIAMSCGYYDQAHFNHDFAAFTGFRPTEYVTLRQVGYGDDLKQGEDVHFVPIG